jgi:hypothetical protein
MLRVAVVEKRSSSGILQTEVAGKDCKPEELVQNPSWLRVFGNVQTRGTRGILNQGNLELRSTNQAQEVIVSPVQNICCQARREEL